MRRAFQACLLLLPLTVTIAQQSDGSTLFNRGTSLYQQGDFRRAYDALTASVELFEKNPKGSEESLMNARLWAGAAAFRLDRLDEADALYRGALLVADASGDAISGANISTALANLKNSTGEYSQAASWYLRAAASFRDAGDTVGARQSTEYAGYVHTLAGQYRDAFSIFNSALIETEPGGASRSDAELAWLFGMRGNAH